MKLPPLISIPILSAVIIVFFMAGCKEKDPDKHNGIRSDTNFTFKKEGEVIFNKADSAVIKKIDVEIAENEAERQQGLMNRPWMEETQGMIFIFEDNKPLSFWMRNTIIPLDIMFVDADFRIVNIAENTQPFSEKGIPSKGNAKYVVEVVAGFSEKYNVQAGDFINFRRVN
ncbi:MAG TPA: DUF192 domain-containing protein [Chitinophagales bacterium]|nr:DUF192 domain-containing protein [Chitinophagales bacterium]